MKNLPNSWLMVDLKDITKNIKHNIVDGPFGTQLKVHEFVDHGIPVIEMQNIKGDKFINVFRRFITKRKLEDIKRSIVYPGDLIISKTGSLGYVAIAPNCFEKAIITSRLAKITLNWNIVNSKYLKYYFVFIRNNGFWEKIAKGTTMKILNIKHLANKKIPLSSLNEQNRIVEKIEELFSDLDKATEDLKKTQKQLKIYRQAVLKAAFEGKLFNMGLVEYFPFSKVCDINPSKQEIVELNDDLEVTFLPMSAVSETGVILEKKTKKLKDVKKGYTFFKNGDVLLAKITPCFENGKKAIVKELKNNIGFGSTEFHVLRPKEEVISEWVFYGVSLEDFRNKAKLHMTGTAGQKRVPKKILESYEIPVPSKLIQKQIVNEIDSRLSVCDKLEETVQQSLKKIEYLRQSILKKAFEGKLVPQNPEDEPAEKLLERIKQEKEKFELNKKKRK